MSRSRLHDATGKGELTTPGGSQPKARVAYVAAWYDGIGRQTASANYGTHGGVTMTIDDRPDSSYGKEENGEMSNITDPDGHHFQTFRGWCCGCH